MQRIVGLAAVTIMITGCRSGPAKEEVERAETAYMEVWKVKSKALFDETTDSFEKTPPEKRAATLNADLLATIRKDPILSAAAECVRAHAEKSSEHKPVGLDDVNWVSIPAGKDMLLALSDLKEGKPGSDMACTWKK